jgi:hypothetical protein
MTFKTLQEQVDSISLNEALQETGAGLEDPAIFLAEAMDDFLFESTFVDATGPNEQPTDAGIDNLMFFNQNRAPMVSDDTLDDTLHPDNYFQHQDEGEAEDSPLKPTCATTAAGNQADMVSYMLGLSEDASDASVKMSEIGGVVGGVDTGSLDQGDDEIPLDDLGADSIESILADGDDDDDDDDDGWVDGSDDADDQLVI